MSNCHATVSISLLLRHILVTGVVTVRAEAEFDELYRRHGREVWAVAYARRLDGDLAGEIMQETFLRLWRTTEAIDNPRAWLLRVARNLAEDTAKSAFRRHGTAGPESLNGIVSRGVDVGASLETAELHATVRAVLAELTPPDRDVLTLKYALDYDAAEIARVLEIAPSAVHMRLSRARQRLAEKLTDQGVSELP